MGIALGWLCLAPPVFWAMTPPELYACLEGRAQFRGLRGAGLGAAEAGRLRAFLEKG